MSKLEELYNQKQKLWSRAAHKKTMRAFHQVVKEIEDIREDISKITKKPKELDIYDR